MNDPLEIAASEVLFVARPEYQLPQNSAVDLPGRVKHTVAKTLSNGVPHRLERQNFVANVVSVDQQHVGITRRNPAGHRTFSRTDSPDYSDNGNGRVV